MQCVPVLGLLSFVPTGLAAIRWGPSTQLGVAQQLIEKESCAWQKQGEGRAGAAAGGTIVGHRGAQLIKDEGSSGSSRCAELVAGRAECD